MGSGWEPDAMTAFPLGIVSNVRQWTGYPASSISLTDEMFTGDNRTVYTFTSRAIGAEASNRIVALAVYSSAAASTVSVTIGGITATRAAGYSVSGSYDLAIYYATVPTGTTATLVVTLSDEGGRCAIDVYRIIPGSSATTYATFGDLSGSASITEIAGGVTVYATIRDTSTAYNVTRNGATLTPDESSVFSADRLVKFGNVSVTGNTNTFASATYSTGLNDGAIVLAHWR